MTETQWWLYFAMRTAHGAVPHLELFQIKNQLASFAGALLYRTGEWAGVEPLLAIRAGWLAIAALLGVILFRVHSIIGRPRVLSGLLGVLAYCALPLLGLLPAMGNRPKLLMSLMATTAMLLAFRQRWFWAGVAAGLAFMDWQIGLLACGAIFVTAVVHGTSRLQAAVRVALGVAAALTPFLIYYAATGALNETLQQVFGGAFYRGSAAFGHNLGRRIENLRGGVQLEFEHREWLLAFVASGIGVALYRLRRAFWKPEARLLLPLCLYHLGMTAYISIDTQGIGDIFVLMHSFAFFLALSWVAIAEGIWNLWLREASGMRRWIFVVAVLVLATAMAQPGPLANVRDLSFGRLRLADQERLAMKIKRRFGDQPVVFFANAELAFLTETVNPLPTVSLIPVAVRHYRLPNEPTWKETAARLVRSVDPAAVLVSRKHRELIDVLGPEYEAEAWGPPNARVYLLVRRR